MSETLEARIEALRMAERLSGSHEYKMKKAEEFYEFLAKGITYQWAFNGLSITNYNPNIPYTLTTTTHE